MHFAIATDSYLGIFQTLVERGWTPLKVFTSRGDGRLQRNAGAVFNYAKQLKLDVQVSRLSESNLRELQDGGCEALVVASYEWRVGNWRPYLKYAVNFHPAPLPRARGAYPIPVAILEEASTWGMACHKVEHDFDSGDVLKIVEFPLSAMEDHDSLDLRLQLAAKRLAADVVDHFVEYWETATPQRGASYYPKWDEAQRRLDFSRTVEQVLRQVRAFGPLECIAHLGKTILFVRRAVGWTESHSMSPGTVIDANGLALVVAVADGYVGLTEWSLINPDTVTGTLRR